MIAKERYVVDENEERIGILQDLSDYCNILEELEELESIHAYDKAKATSGEAIPFENAIGELERKRQ